MKSTSPNKLPSEPGVILNTNLKRKREEDYTSLVTAVTGPRTFQLSKRPFNKSAEVQNHYQQSQNHSDENQCLPVQSRNEEDSSEEVHSDSAAVRNQILSPVSLQAEFTRRATGIYDIGINSADALDTAEVITSIYSITVDAMSCCLSFLQPTEVYSVLTAPLSKMWLTTYAGQEDLWKVLCISDPFRANLIENTEEVDEGTTCFPINSDHESDRQFGQYRLLFSVFIRFTKYLGRMKEDAIKGSNSHSSADNSTLGRTRLNLCTFRGNESLQSFLLSATELASQKQARNEDMNGQTAKNVEEHQYALVKETSVIAESKEEEKKLHCTSKQRMFSHSALTERLLKTLNADYFCQPQSCAIFSVVNCMIFFADVEGMQIKCLEVLPSILHKREQRITARHTGLFEALLRAMILYPESVKLHSAAFHTLVHLARPVEGNEAMQQSLEIAGHVDSSEGFGCGTTIGESGIAVLLESMRRFIDDQNLQAMGCWAMVNIALDPAHKSMLVNSGGISVVTEAMTRHPKNAEVQFRALFALINLVISESISLKTSPRHRNLVSSCQSENLVGSLSDIAQLIVAAMRTFHNSVVILNRACLVLHNLSLEEENHEELLLTPYLYNVVEWSLANYLDDKVLQQSAGGTLIRLQSTLKSNRWLRSQFFEALHLQH